MRWPTWRRFAYLEEVCLPGGGSLSPAVCAAAVERVCHWRLHCPQPAPVNNMTPTNMTTDIQRGLSKHCHVTPIYIFGLHVVVNVKML